MGNENQLEKHSIKRSSSKFIFLKSKGINVSLIIWLKLLLRDDTFQPRITLLNLYSLFHSQ